MTARKIKFTRHTKDSKNFNRYEEVPDQGQPPVLNQLYVAKWFAQDAKEIVVIVEIPDVKTVQPQQVRETLLA